MKNTLLKICIRYDTCRVLMYIHRQKTFQIKLNIFVKEKVKKTNSTKDTFQMRQSRANTK